MKKKIMTPLFFVLLFVILLLSIIPAYLRWSLLRNKPNFDKAYDMLEVISESEFNEDESTSPPLFNGESVTFSFTHAGLYLCVITLAISMILMCYLQTPLAVTISIIIAITVIFIMHYRSVRAIHLTITPLQIIYTSRKKSFTVNINDIARIGEGENLDKEKIIISLSTGESFCYHVYFKNKKKMLSMISDINSYIFLREIEK